MKSIKFIILYIVFIFQIQNTFSQTFTEMTAISLARLGYSASWGDFDNDDDLDLLLTGYNGSDRVSKLYRNDSTLSFTEITGSGIIGYYYNASAWGDYDNDGDLDIVISGYDSVLHCRLYRNDGSNTFTQMTGISLTGLSDGEISWGDYDNDGDLDILNCGWNGYDNSTKIYRNNGSNSFTEMTGLNIDGISQGSAKWGDYDNDGDLDLLISGLKIVSFYYYRCSKIYRNDGPSTYTEMTGISLIQQYYGAADWGDYDSDGDLDIVMTGSTGTGRSTRIYRNDGSNTFTEMTAFSLTGLTNSSISWGDMDNDGDLDILLSGNPGSTVNTKIYRNNNGSSFTEMTGINLAGIQYGKASWNDYDHDGDLDILVNGQDFNSNFICKLYRNDCSTGNSAPAAPASLSVTATGAQSTFSWSRPTDDHTSQNSLTYNIYIGTGSGSANILPAMSNISNGFRKVISRGNSQFNSSGTTIKGLPVGTYYWGVQAIDNSFKAGNFASGGSFSILPFTEMTSISLSGIETGSSSWGDFDNDNDLDLLISGQSASGVYTTSLYRNEGNSAFTEMTSVSLTGVHSSSVVWADCDNDNDLDILLCGNNGTSPLSKIYRNNGNQTFTELTAAGLTGIYSGSAAWADYDKDGDPDILLSGATATSQTTKIYRNNGSNSFTEMTSVSLPGLSGSSVAWGDYDKDGDPDILMSGYTGSTQLTRIYRNDGSDVFTQLTGISFTQLSNGSVAWGDYDSDGDLDILICGNTGSSKVMKIYRNDGSSTFNEMTGISLGGIYNGAAVWGDCDNDGDLDILSSGNSGSGKVTRIYQNNGSGNFAEMTLMTFSGLDYSATSWADYDNDGDLDFFATGSNSSSSITSRIYRNNFTFTNAAPSAPVSLVSTVNGYNVGLSWSRPADDHTPSAGLTYNVYMGTTPGGTNILSPMAGLSNGYKMMATAGNAGLNFNTFNLGGLANGKYYWKVQAVDNSFKGSSFSATDSFVLAPFTENTSAGLYGLYYGCSVWGDYDNDGDLDIILAGYNPSYTSVSLMYTNNGTSAFTPVSVTYLIGATESAISMGDYDNDGDLDILLSGKYGALYNTSFNKVYRNNGTGVFSEMTGISLEPSYSGSNSWVDYDNDGDLDIFVCGTSNPGIISTIYQNNGGNNFRDMWMSISFTSVSRSSCTWADADNDGDMDLLLSGMDNNGNNITKIYRNDGNDVFTDMTGIGITGIQFGSSAWGDYDNDGDLDILIAGKTTSSRMAKIYRNNGSFSFTEMTGISLTPVNDCSVAWGDCDNDGDLDIVLAGNTGSNYITKIYQNGGSNTFTEMTGVYLPGLNRCSVKWGDYDNDGDLDILMNGEDNNHVFVSKIFTNNVVNGNSPPGSPGSLSVTVDGFDAVFNWSKPTDDHTSQNSLTYNLYIGTSSGGNQAVTTDVGYFHRVQENCIPR